MQTGNMFFSEFLCLAIYFIHRGLTLPINKEDQPEDAPIKYKLLFGISAMFDMLNFFLSVFGLTMAAASIYQMMYGGTLFWTFILNVFYLKKTYYRQHYFAVSLLLSGLIIVGLAGIIWSKSSDEGTPTKPIGVIMIILAQVFSALQNIAEEIIFRKHKGINPLQATGIEGAAGFLCMAILLPILNHVGCTTQTDAEGNALFCPYGVIEDSWLAIRQIVYNRNMALYVVGYTVSTLVFNSIGISIVKYTSSMERTVISCARIFMVWLVSIIIGWEGFIPLQVFFYT